MLLSNVLFKKSNVHKMYKYMPSNFTAYIVTISARVLEFKIVKCPFIIVTVCEFDPNK